MGEGSEGVCGCVKITFSTRAGEPGEHASPSRAAYPLGCPNQWLTAFPSSLPPQPTSDGAFCSEMTLQTPPGNTVLLGCCAGSQYCLFLSVYWPLLTSIPISTDVSPHLCFMPRLCAENHLSSFSRYLMLAFCIKILLGPSIL